MGVTEAGCPPDFHIQLLAELTQVNLDDQWIVIVGSRVTARGARWIHASSSASWLGQPVAIEPSLGGARVGRTDSRGRSQL